LSSGSPLKQDLRSDLASFPDLLGFFDRAFSAKLSERFPSAKDMISKLDSLIKVHRDPVTNESETDLQAILSALSSDANTKLAKHKLLYDRAMHAIRSVHDQLARKVAPTYQTFQSGYVNFAEGLRNTLGFSHFATQDRRFAPTFLIRIVGEELVVEVNDQTVYRTDVDEPVFSEEFTSIVQNIFLKGLRDLVDLPPL
jgi:serine/threonine-protein kinase